MEGRIVRTSNRLTQRPHSFARSLTVAMTCIVILLGLWYFRNSFEARSWMPANGQLVFEQGQYWRLWTTLFAHGDFAHLLGNLFVFVPFCFFLIGYFSLWFFPVLALITGGITNYLVLSSMPSSVHLIGLSGVTYWMGGAWLVLYLLLDTRRTLRRRFAGTLVLLLYVFFPESFKAEVSYASHAWGMGFGILSGIIYYLLRRRMFEKDDDFVIVVDPPLESLAEQIPEA